MRKILDKRFFQRSAVKVAKELIGKYLVRKIGPPRLAGNRRREADRKEVALMITETEAYDGPEDLASHASKGKTKRTEIMFGEAGYLYVYLIYGMYFMLNVVTDKKDYPSAVLIRGVEGHNGPGKVARHFEIDKRLNHKPALRSTGLWFEDREVKIKKTEILRTPRIGVDYAGEIWKEKLYRFVLKKKKAG